MATITNGAKTTDEKLDSFKGWSELITLESSFQS